MSDRLFFALTAVTAAAMIAYAAIWPQGLGARSPGPFGHTPVQQTPAMQAAMAREAARTQKKYQNQAEAVTAQLRHTMTPNPPSATPRQPSSTFPGTPPGSSAPPRAAASKRAPPADLRLDQ
jgi:hypothetical protein